MLAFLLIVIFFLFFFSFRPAVLLLLFFGSCFGLRRDMVAPSSSFSFLLLPSLFFSFSLHQPHIAPRFFSFQIYGWVMLFLLYLLLLLLCLFLSLFFFLGSQLVYVLFYSRIISMSVRPQSASSYLTRAVTVLSFFSFLFRPGIGFFSCPVGLNCGCSCYVLSFFSLF